MRRESSLALCAATFVCALSPTGAESASQPGSLRHPDWHPDGARLAAEGSCAGDGDIYLIELAAPTLTRIWDGGAVEGYPRWFADGQRIAFHRIDPDAGTARLYVADVSAAGVVSSVTAVGDGPYDIEPAPSPDGLSLAHSSWGDATLDIAVSSLSGAQRRRWSTDDEENFPSWTPDGTRLIYHASRDGAPAQIFTRQISSGALEQITTSAGPNLTGHFGSDGAMLAFASERDGDREIYLMDLRAGTQRRLTHHPGRDGYPKLSPDGRRIAFHSAVSEIETVIRVLDLQSGEALVVACGGARLE